MNSDDVLQRLRAHANPDNVAGMARYGINPENTLGVTVPTLRKFAKEIGKDHALAQELWASRVHEARILAALVDDPRQVTEAQMEAWAGDFDSWDICDGCCGNLFDKTPFAYRMAAAWSGAEGEYMKRAGFALMTQLAVHDKAAPDEAFLAFLPLIVREASDGRNYVKKAVNWALRQIGKRNTSLHRAALGAAEEIQQSDVRSARWVAADALRELTSAAVQRRLAAQVSSRGSDAARKKGGHVGSEAAGAAVPSGRA